MKHPIQPLDKINGVVRFKQNAIVSYLLDLSQKHGCGLNEIACMNFSNEDRMQLAQLIGYSLSGYRELGYVDSDSYGAAEKMADGKNEDAARIEYLESELAALRAQLREPIARLFGIHPDNLKNHARQPASEVEKPPDTDEQRNASLHDWIGSRVRVIRGAWSGDFGTVTAVLQPNNALRVKLDKGAALAWFVSELERLPDKQQA